MMIMKCGGCGCETHKLKAEGNNPRYTKIMTICTQCGSRSVIELAQPRMQVSWYEDSNGSETDKGVICTGWNEED